ncbi:MAG TPA: hypothetical protein VER55_02685, partial [Ardenticatenaceae bacterium]|nr:hypothetical protein [Ardenticatenaceae bacterium]
LSEHLGLRVRIEDKRLRLIDAATGERLLSPAEVAEARRLAERRLAETEAELARLREELARLRGEADKERSA